MSSHRRLTPEERAQRDAQRVYDREMKKWGRECQKAQKNFPASEVKAKPFRFRPGRHAVRSPCGIMCTDSYTLAIHQRDCADCATMVQIRGA